LGRFILPYGWIVENAARGYVQLTEDGRRFYAEHGDGITLAMVKGCPRFIEHQEASSSESEADESSDFSSTITPEGGLQGQTWLPQ